MSYDPAGLTHVEFQDEDDPIEGGQIQVDFADNDALLEQLSVMDLPPLASTRRRPGRPWCKLCVVLIPILVAISTALYFLARPSRASSKTSIFSSSKTSIAHATSPLKPPPADISSRCLAITDECRTACEYAECCNFPANLELSCLYGNEDTCLAYQKHCSILEDGLKPLPTKTKIISAPSNLKDICTVEKIITVDGFQECQEACRPAQCCYDANPEVDPCSNEECAEYSPCLILDATDNVRDDIPQHITEKCANLDDVQGRTECRKACAHALCCFLEGDLSCPQTDTNFCDQYQACHDLENDVNVVADASEIEMICDSHFTSMCEYVCERGACCFTDESCPASDIPCDQYSACSKLYGNLHFTTGTQQIKTNGVTKAQVNELCVDIDPDDVEGSDCEQICNGAKCCFSDEGCGSRKINCGIYKECDIVFGGEGTFLGKKPMNDDHLGIIFKVDVDDACIDYDPADDSQKDSLCPKLCKDAGCCFQHTGCKASISCYTFSECDIIYENTGTTIGTNGGGGGGGGDGGNSEFSGITVTGDEIFEACDRHDEEVVEASDGETLCSLLCKPFKCCFDGCTIPSDVSCGVGNGCAVLYPGKKNTGMTDNTSTTDGNQSGSGSGGNDFSALKVTGDEIYEACDRHDEEVVEDADGETLCSLLCKSFKCCFEGCTIPTDVSCGVGNGCAVLYPGKKNTGMTNTSTTDGSQSGSGSGGNDFSSLKVTGDEIYEACDRHDEEVVEDADGETLCSLLCKSFNCCFEGCTIPTGVNCDVGNGCAVLHKGKENSGGGSTSSTTTTGSSNGGDSGSSINETAVLREACQNHFAELKASSGKITKCQKMCRKYECCDPDFECDPDGVDCKIGQECNIMWNPSTGEEAGTSSLRESILKACEVDSNMNQCENLCPDGRCCFESQNCQPPGNIVCDDFQGCLVLYAIDEGEGDEEEDGTPLGGDESEFTYDLNDFSAEDISSACSGSAVSSMCSKLCSPAECCFKTEGCSGNAISCQKYISCAKLWK